MKVNGEALLHADVEAVWTALNDPAVLERTIPGCQSLTEIGPDAYRMTITAGVASIKGSYDGEVRISDQQRPSSFRLHAQGSGAPGTVSADVVVRLQESGPGQTAVTYDADATIGGMVAGVGQRVLAGVAKKTAGEFFRAVDDVLTGAAAPAAVRVPAQAGPADRPTRLPAAVASAQPSASLPGNDFAKGALVGGLLTLAGVVVGGLLARRKP